jgi:hypothetical protein
MKRFIKTTLLAAMLMISISAFAGQVSIGIRIGAPPPPHVLKVVPHSPGAGYVWVDGYWYPTGTKNKYTWHNGYWTRPPQVDYRWVAPRHDGSMYYQGYWDGDHGRMDHDHKSDKNSKDRDYHH